MALEVSPGALFSQAPEIAFRTERLGCGCGGALLVQKSRRKRILTLAGPFVARETVHFCDTCGAVYVSEALSALVPRGCNVAYDVLVFVGRGLFQRHRTVQELLCELAAHNLRLSASEVTWLGRKFIAYLARAHCRSTPCIREAMTLAGGYILHIDAMHAGEAPALMSALDGISHIVLDNAKLPTENADSIEPFLRQLEGRFGTPLACVHDMGVGICTAVENVFGNVPDFICHFHFLRDVGKDLLEPAYAQLRKRLRKHSVSTRLHALARSLGEQLVEQRERCPGLARAIREAEEPNDPASVPLAAAYALVRWTLRGKHVGDGYGYPFDRPLFSFAERLLELQRRMPEFKDVFLSGDCKDNTPLYKLYRELSRVVDDGPLRRALKELRWRSALFDSLRNAMRIAPPNGTMGLNDEGASEDMGRIKDRVCRFRSRLDTDPELAGDTLCGKVAAQIDRYGPKLFADPITVTPPHGTLKIQPQRTNNILEQFFRGIRRGYRRRTGNDSMRRALNSMAADTPLVKNLDNPRYMDMILDGNRTLEELFAQLDTQPAQNDGDAGEEHPKLTAFSKLIALPRLPDLVAKLFGRAAPSSKSNRILAE